MTKYYLQVIKSGISICLDTHLRYGGADIISIHMYSDNGSKVVFGEGVEYDAQFRLERHPNDI